MPTPSWPPSGATLPRSFGRYVLFDLVGRGGMAEIYLARAKTQEAGGSRLVVVKQILPELSSAPKFADALVQEAKLAARLSHANVVQVLDLGRAPEGPSEPAGRLYITMEYVEGLDLSEILRRCARQKVPLPIEFSLLIVMEALRGLDYAHRRTDDAGKPLGIVHRDVSPSNILVSVEGEVKMCDFGIARANDLADALGSQAIQGKAGYMSPEHARGEPLDARADVFAAGVILWELLAGRRLYKADKTKNESLLELARRAEVPPLPAQGIALEDDLYAIVHRALRVDPSERWESAAAMLEALQRYVAKARVIASPIRLGEWITQHFGQALVDARRARERAIKALEAGPAATITPSAPPTSARAKDASLGPPPRSPLETARGADARPKEIGGAIPSLFPVAPPKVRPASLPPPAPTPLEAEVAPTAKGARSYAVWVALALAIAALVAVFLLRK
jgi:serine/threonine-protein kinase